MPLVSRFQQVLRIIAASLSRPRATSPREGRGRRGGDWADLWRGGKRKDSAGAGWRSGGCRARANDRRHSSGSARARCYLQSPEGDTSARTRHDTVPNPGSHAGSGLTGASTKCAGPRSRAERRVTLYRPAGLWISYRPRGRLPLASPSRGRGSRPCPGPGASVPTIEVVQLQTPVRRPDAFDDPEWLFEPMYDGFRGLLHSTATAARSMSPRSSWRTASRICASGSMPC